MVTMWEGSMEVRVGSKKKSKVNGIFLTVIQY
jgi:hypothetical protein